MAIVGVIAYMRKEGHILRTFGFTFDSSCVYYLHAHRQYHILVRPGVHPIGIGDVPCCTVSEAVLYVI